MNIEEKIEAISSEAKQVYCFCVDFFKQEQRLPKYYEILRLSDFSESTVLDSLAELSDEDLIFDKGDDWEDLRFFGLSVSLNYADPESNTIRTLPSFGISVK